MSSEPIEHRAIRIDAKGVCEMDRSEPFLGAERVEAPRPLVHIPSGEVVALERAFGAAAEHPVTATVLAVVLLLIAAFPFAFLVAIFIRGGHMRGVWFWLATLAVPAFWILGLVFRQRDLLIVHTHKGHRRLIFHGSGEPAEIETFLAAASSSFGYRIGRPADDVSRQRIH